jgi:hypothetical protein
MKIYIVTNLGKSSRLVPYAASTMVFLRFSSAMAQAKKWGFDGGFLGIPTDIAIGTKSMYMCGDVHVEILATKLIES